MAANAASKETGATGDIVIACDGLWKVYRADADTARTIVAERLSKAEAQKRHDAVVAVSDVSFEVKRGEIFCIMGLSGSGKSTVIRHVNRLIEPTAGRISIAGRDIAAMNERDLLALRAAKIGMVFQNMALLPHRTVRDNVAFGLEIRNLGRAERYRIADETLQQVQLDGWGYRYPSELSGGMQQRVGIARALAINPEILLMDEPFSALDPLIRRSLQDQFLDLARRLAKTTLFITHDLEEAMRVGDRIAIMRDGAIVQVGTPAEVLLRPVDDYVAGFTEGMSRLKYVTAGSIMKTGGGEGSGVRVRPEATLDMLVDRAAGGASSIVVEDEAGRPIGSISTTALLEAIRTHR